MSKGRFYCTTCLEDVKYLVISVSESRTATRKNEFGWPADEGNLQLKGERRGSYYVPGPALLEHGEKVYRIKYGHKKCPTGLNYGVYG